jgi:hypothetical protein
VGRDPVGLGVVDLTLTAMLRKGIGITRPTCDRDPITHVGKQGIVWAKVMVISLLCWEIICWGQVPA